MGIIQIYLNIVIWHFYGENEYEIDEAVVFNTFLDIS